MTLRLAALAALLAPLAAVAQPGDPPEWVRDAVVYRLVPDRFANGDLRNDPTWASLGARARIDSALWRPTPWTADWYRRDAWEVALGPDFYEDGAFQRRLGGDLQGVLDRVLYLDSLGVTAVDLHPLFRAGAPHHIDPFLGPDPRGDLALLARETADPASWHWTAADRLFLELVRVLHQRGLRVVVGVSDLAGTGVQAPPAAGAHPPPDPDGTGPHAGVNARVRDATRRWMDPDGDGDPSDGVDGWRLDGGTGGSDRFWRDWTALVHALNPNAYTAAEAWGDAASVMDRTGFQATPNGPATAIPLDALLVDGQAGAEPVSRETAERLAADPEGHRFALHHGAAGPGTGRLASRIVNGWTGAAGDRVVRAPTAAERDVQRLAVTWGMAALPGAPVVAYGDEAGMWGADAPDDLKPMVWPDQAYEPEARDPRGRPRAPDAVAFDHGLFRFYRDAIALRQRDVVLRRGSAALLSADSAAQTVVVERRLADARRVVVVNRSDASRFVPLGGEGVPQPLVPLFSSSGDLREIPALVAVWGETDRLTYGLRIPARTVVVFRPADPVDVRPRGLDE